MKKRFLKLTAVIFAVLMMLPFIQLAYAEDAPAEITDILESCTLYKKAGTDVYYFYMKLYPNWTLTEPSQWQCNDLKLRLINSQGEPCFAVYHTLTEEFFDVTHTFILRYAAADNQDPWLLAQSEVLFPTGFFVNSEMQRSDALTLAIDIETMNADRVCYCPYMSYTALSSPMVGGKMNCADNVWVPVGTEPELRFEMEDAQAHRMHAVLDKETGYLTILRRGVTIHIILYADGEQVDTRAYCAEKTFDDLGSFLLGTLEAFGQGIVDGGAGITGSFRTMLLFIIAPFAVLFEAIGGGIAKLFRGICEE